MSDGQRSAVAAVDRLPPPGIGRANGGPCWLSLASRDVLAAKEFYARVLGWCHVPVHGSERPARFLAVQAGAPVGSLSQATCELGVAAGWIPYFTAADVDSTVARLRERGATVAVGPLATGTGRIAVAAGLQDGVFGLREQAPDDRWQVGEGPVSRLELYTGDVFAAALLYGGALGWADLANDGCEVQYRDGRIAVHDGRRTVATINDAALADAAPPGWQACFRVADVDLAAEAALDTGGLVVSPPRGPHQRREAVLGDREGNAFTVTAC